MKNKLLMTFVVLATLAMITLVSANEGFNVPLGAEAVTTIRSETSNISNYAPESVEALAGNLTELTITGVSSTRSWQGFFGNITGTIILEDSSGFRFYDWEAAEPRGQVYAATTGTVTWTTVACANLSNEAYRLAWYTTYGMLDTDYDNINMTYNRTDHDEFYVGFTTLNNCRTTYTFVSSARQVGTQDFQAVLLTDDNDAMIFTAIIENRNASLREGQIGYDGGDYDFQLLVAENGQNANTDTTTYYFWLELE